MDIAFQGFIGHVHTNGPMRDNRIEFVKDEAGATPVQNG
jgi:hypothetical protein